ncbi:acyl-CoA dehydrogenase family protein [Streptomyces sp. UNOB3_S3]|uniref:acyl-CoA dehydrogenase family protein n=1 Tax=Streptomyces sp. UNOB3_S3 TaxID=2871682 RepID=UPI001E4F9ACA|nr:acyl-CoA dehydrogenase family protein [Streptomyces sp. UNOB3_S3]MCC3778191.1 acyl-CoA/acyl-ACP dehydrogenase [Streptomyces sp. UNOB3_S3]
MTGPTAPSLDDTEVLTATTRVADELLRPRADGTAREGVPRGHLDALAAAGALGLATRAPALLRQATEIISAADGATWFVYAQHHQPVRAVAASDNQALRERWLTPLLTGRALSGHAISHLARPGPPAVTATPGAGGDWALNGRIAWLTGWGLADVVLAGAIAPDDRVLFALLPAEDLDAPRAVHRHTLWSMHATHAVAIDLNDVPVGRDQVVSVSRHADWLRAYLNHNANTHPAVFGSLRATSRFLAQYETFQAWSDSAKLRAGRLRSRAYGLIDTRPAGEAVGERLATRAAAVDLALRTAAACVAAAGARSMSSGTTAARLMAEASFHLVHSQTPQAKDAYARLAGALGGSC